MKLSDSERAAAWLSHFRLGDDLVVRDLLNNFQVISTSNFRTWINQTLESIGTREAPVALYSEREFPRGQRFFPQMAPGPTFRSIGRNGPALVRPTRGSVHVGSEGIVAQLLTELVRRDKKSFLLTPGPDRLRPLKTRPAVHKIAIVTDLIGSGARISKMLDALWRTETFRSWQSHLRSRVQIHIVAYASTISGEKAVRSHRLKPELHFAVVAPTIRDLYHGRGMGPVEGVCKYYNPIKGDPIIGDFGYENIGTLIAFGHGCPNTTPPIFWADKGSRPPLFPNRSAVSFDSIFHLHEGVAFSSTLLSLGQPTLSNPELLAHFGEQASQALLVLAAIARGLRGVPKLSVRTGLNVVATENLIKIFQTVGWCDSDGALTEAGLVELKAARSVLKPRPPLPGDRVSVYFPRSLRG
ncbi:phosphoribosyltransferase-like protein [Rhizobium bangladeshense]|uniref:phosphoribosyltransferase-like protein n=1 Tax=Rhizobium bangladeshense TaxID=1138189 RepID=UPI003CCFC3EE